jgi:hypothetical protein
VRLVGAHLFRSTKSGACTVARVVGGVYAAVVLDGGVLDFLPHLLDGLVEVLVGLVLKVDEVVRLVLRFLGCTTRLRQRSRCDRRLRREGEDARVVFGDAHLELVVVFVIGEFGSRCIECSK